MDVAGYYENLPFELSGSRSKNRFRMELLWGVSVMLDLMEEDRDFTVVFDYVCDIEIHYKDSLEFHQIKTHGSSFGPYSIASLIKSSSKKSAGSILGKLYALKTDDSSNIKLVLVSNIPLRTRVQNCNCGEFCLTDLPDRERLIIESALKRELGVSSVEMSRLFYLHTHLNLLDPESQIRGKLNKHFDKVKHCEPHHPNALYRLIFDAVQRRACYEYSEREYESIIKLKGISRSEFSQMLDIHADNEKSGIRQAEEFIRGIGGFYQKHRYRKALARLLEQMPTATPLRKLETHVAQYLLSHETEEVTDPLALLSEMFGSQIPLEYTQEEKDLFFIIVMGRFEMGAYDHGNDL